MQREQEYTMKSLPLIPNPTPSFQMQFDFPFRYYMHI